MARIRTVKPELFKHEVLFEAEQDTGLPLRLAFIGLFCVADREGRFKWRPRQIKLDVLPYDTTDFAKVLDALELHGLVLKYQVQGETYGVITGFKRHQVINKREASSVIPPPPAPEKTSANTVETTCEASADTDKALSDSGNSGAPDDSAQVTHVHAHAEQVRARGEKEGKGREKEGNNILAHSDELAQAEILPPEDLASPPTEAPPPEPEQDDEDEAETTETFRYPVEFEAAWKLYPRRFGGNPKRKAYRAWCARLREDSTVDQMQAGTVRYAKFCKATDKLDTEYVMQAVTFYGPDLNFLEPWETSKRAGTASGTGGTTAGQAWAASRMGGARS